MIHNEALSFIMDIFQVEV